MERVQRKSRDEWRRKIQQDKRFMRNRIVTAILPVLKEWSQRGHGTAIPHDSGTDQARLSRVVPAPDREGVHPALLSLRHEAPDNIDSPEHMVQKCPTWREQRTALRTIMRGEDLSLESIVRGIVSSREKWAAFSRFCEEIL